MYKEVEEELISFREEGRVWKKWKGEIEIGVGIGGEGRSERARGEESMTTSPMGLCNPLREGTVQTGWEETH